MQKIGGEETLKDLFERFEKYGLRPTIKAELGYNDVTAFVEINDIEIDNSETDAKVLGHRRSLYDLEQGKIAGNVNDHQTAIEQLQEQKEKLLELVNPSL